MIRTSSWSNHSPNSQNSKYGRESKFLELNNESTRLNRLKLQEQRKLWSIDFKKKDYQKVRDTNHEANQSNKARRTEVDTITLQSELQRKENFDLENSSKNWIWRA